VRPGGGRPVADQDEDRGGEHAEPGRRGACRQAKRRRRL